jgi:4-diphosphocytidyl-2-C-methyl-D-erythritol kinase
MTVKESPVFTDTAYAKLNLALHVRRRREDGYHELETLFAFLDTGDRMQVRAADRLTLTIEGPFADDLDAGPDNLVLRAANLLQEHTAVSAGAAFLLNKRLPIASGIGGGSADAAAALRLAAQLWGLAGDDPRLMAVARQVGADVPACLLSQTCVGTGVGDDLQPVSVDGIAGTAALLVNPLLACPTGPVFAQWDGIDRGPLDIATWRRGRNDLQEAAIGLCPDILEVLTVLKAQLPAVTRMSGSGATCFGLFANAGLRDAAAQRIAADHPDWWLMSGQLR